MKAFLVMLLTVLWTPTCVLAWGELGHRAIGEAVQDSLDEATKDAIANAIEPGAKLADGTLAKLSVWPDKIRKPKDLPAEDQPPARAFNAAHPANAVWHFVNLPLKAAGYPDLSSLSASDPLRKFVRTDPEKGDVVQKITDVMAILESETPPAGWTKTEALAWLLHLVEDLHQPLHVSSGYYRLGNHNVPRLPILQTPAAASQKHIACDRGGNQLEFHSPKKELHGVWDNCLAQVVAGMSCTASSGLPGVAALAQRLATRMQDPSSAQYQPAGDYHEWAAQWVTDSLRVAREANVYGVTLTNPTTVGAIVKKSAVDPCSSKGQKIKFTISAPVLDGYVTQFQPIAALQLTKAAVRLAALLKHIRWH